MRLTFGEGAEWHHALSFQLFYKETKGGLIRIAFVQRKFSYKFMCNYGFKLGYVFFLIMFILGWTEVWNPGKRNPWLKPIVLMQPLNQTVRFEM